MFVPGAPDRLRKDAGAQVRIAWLVDTGRARGIRYWLRRGTIAGRHRATAGGDCLLEFPRHGSACDAGNGAEISAGCAHQREFGVNS